MSGSINTNSIEVEYQDICGENAWLDVFQKLSRECLGYRYSIMEAKKQENKHLNRYRDVNPYDHTRIVLDRGSVDYINANLVKMERAERRYILTQGPLSITVGHFWLMVWEQRSKAIVMLNKLVEKRESKCHMYWPATVGAEGSLELPDVKLRVQMESEEDHEYYWTRRFKIFDLASEECREVDQFHYITWPDFGVPSSPVEFLNFLNEVRQSSALEPECGPAVVHCSAGIGRSGTFCLVDSCLVIIEQEQSTSYNVSVQELLLEMRRDRMGLVQTPDQLKFSYQAILEGVKRMGILPFDPVDFWKEYLNEAERAEKLPAKAGSGSDSEDEPPPPPPRVGSLDPPPPARPLPALPTYSLSADFKDNEELFNSRIELNSSNELISTNESNSPNEFNSTNEFNSSNELNADSDESESETPTPELPADLLRKRKREDLAERVKAMQKKARDTEKWTAIKRSLYKPFTITLGFLLAGIVYYAYHKY